ncbi:MAG: glycosyltransferase family 2 protein [Actinobacteria bacterium]|nr:glycosyltransferase family 2 protein [Actinomycetota bacterium]
MDPGTDGGDATSDGPTVAVCICTYRRPEVLRRLLDRLVDDVADLGHRARVGVVVVDDDPDRSATPVLDEFEGRFELGLHGRTSGLGDISRARNLAIDTGREIGEWLAIVDDDCLPDVGWIRNLLVVQTATGADCVSGACLDEAPAGAPAWLTEEPFLEVPADLPDGAPIEIGHLKNTLVRSSLVGPGRVRFRDELGASTGGEDAVFFYDLHDRGVTHVFASRPLVREVVPVDRTTYRYQLRRAYWYGNTEAVTSLYRGNASRLRLAAGGAKRSLVAVRWLVPARGRWWWRYGIAQLASGFGRVLGTVGVRLDHH